MRKLAVAIMIASLVGCSMGHRDPVEAKNALNEAVNEANSRSLAQLPASVEADLMPELDNETVASISTVKRFRIKANGVGAKAFFASLVQGTQYSAAVHPDVEGSITVNLTDVTLDEVLNVVRDIYGYDITKAGNVIQVYPAGIRTVTIPVDYLQFKRSGRSLTSISTGTITNTDTDSSNSDSDSNSNSNSSSRSRSTNTAKGGTEIETISESDFWPQLEVAVSKLIGQ